MRPNLEHTDVFAVSLHKKSDHRGRELNTHPWAPHRHDGHLGVCFIKTETDTNKRGYKQLFTPWSII